MNKSYSLTLKWLVSTKWSHMLCPNMVCLSMCDTLVETKHWRVKALHSFLENLAYVKEWNKLDVEGTVLQIEKARLNDRLRVSKYPKNLAFQLFLVLQ